jgi:hypothetical protein
MCALKPNEQNWFVSRIVPLDQGALERSLSAPPYFRPLVAYPFFAATSLANRLLCRAAAFL